MVVFAPVGDLQIRLARLAWAYHECSLGPVVLRCRFHEDEIPHGSRLWTTDTADHMLQFSLFIKTLALYPLLPVCLRVSLVHGT